MRNQETSLKKARNNPEKLRENKKSAASTEDRTEDQGTGVQRHNHHTIWNLKLWRQKDDVSVDSRSRISKGNYE